MAGRSRALERRGVLLEKVEERAILDERGLDRFGDARRASRDRGACEKRDVVDHGKRRRERAEIVLLAERVDAVLDAHRRVVLRQHRRRDADQPDAAMRGRRGIACGVEHRAAADRDDIGMAAEAARR